MSLTFAFDGTEPILSANYFPPIELDPKSQYLIGLLSFQTYNSIPNVDSENNKFYYDGDKVIEIPTGAYEIKDIANYIREELRRRSTKAKQYYVDITTNNNTMQTTIKATFSIDFTKKDSIGKLLGFTSDTIVQAGQRVTTTDVVDVFKVNAIRIECNIATGSYVNDNSVHTIHQFYPGTPAGYMILELPSPVIYLPITTNTIDNITLRIVDQTGRLINFRKERISIRIHIKKAD